MPLTGASSVHGQDGLAAIQLALEDANAAGGINGHSIEIRIEDTASKPSSTVEAMQKLINIDKVPVVLGPITSAETLAAAEVADRQKIFLFSPTAASAKVEGRSPYCFTIGLMTEPQGERLADYCFNMVGIKSMGILAMNDETGTALADSFEKHYVALGGKVQYRLEYRKDDTEFRTALASLKARQVTKLYVSAVPRTMGLIVKQANEIGYAPAFFASAGIEGQDFLTTAGELANGTVFTGLNAKKEFLARFEQRTKRQPSVSAPQGFDAFNLTLDAIRSKGPTADGIREYLAHMPPFTGVGGEIRFDAQGRLVRKAELRTVRSGRFSPL